MPSLAQTVELLREKKWLVERPPAPYQRMYRTLDGWAQRHRDVLGESGSAKLIDALHAYASERPKSSNPAPQVLFHNGELMLNSNSVVQLLRRLGLHRPASAKPAAPLAPKFKPSKSAIKWREIGSDARTHFGPALEEFKKLKKKSDRMS